MSDLNILKCVDCGDLLTWGEENTYWNYMKRQGLPPRCYECDFKFREARVVQKNKELAAMKNEIEALNQLKSDEDNALSLGV